MTGNDTNRFFWTDRAGRPRGIAPAGEMQKWDGRGRPPCLPGLTGRTIPSNWVGGTLRGFPIPARQGGFTLIEIMVVVVILAILAGIVLPKILERPEEARRVKAEVQIRNVEAALYLYKIDNGFYPTTEQGLDALIHKPTAGRIPNNWKDGGYIDRIPADPWGGSYVYLSPGAHGDYDLYSLGSDGEEGGEGKDSDVQSWNLQ